MSIIDKVASKVYSARARAHYDKMLKIGLNRLKKEGIYRPLSLTGQKPIAMESRFHRKKDIGWHDYYFSLSGIKSESFIPPSIFYPLIEPILNQRMMVKVIKDKNYYGQILPEDALPRSPLRRIGDFYFNEKYEPINVAQELLESILAPYQRLILKSSLDTGAGKGIILFERDGDVFKSEDGILSIEFLKKCKFDFVLQEYVEQHEFFSSLNPSSVNTIRLFTYRSVKNDSLNIVCALLKIGKKGCFMDHSNLGGVSIPISDTGEVGDFACNVDGAKMNEFNRLEIASIGQIPNFDAFGKLALQVASKSYYGRLLGLDFTMDQDGRPLLLDINCWRNGINQFQFCHGTLFGKHTEEIIRYCNSVTAQNVITIAT